MGAIIFAREAAQRIERVSLVLGKREIPLTPSQAGMHGEVRAATIEGVVEHGHDLRVWIYDSTGHTQRVHDEWVEGVGTRLPLMAMNRELDRLFIGTAQSSAPPGTVLGTRSGWSPGMPLGAPVGAGFGAAAEALVSAACV